MLLNISQSQQDQVVQKAEMEKFFTNLYTPEYRHTDPRGSVLWLPKSTQIKYPTTHNPAQRLKEIKCTETAPVFSHVAIHKPRLPDTGDPPGRDSKVRDLSLDRNCMHFCE